MDLNIKSLFSIAQAAARQFIQQGRGGKIINIASMLSYQGGIRVPYYTASKSAVMGVTRLMANEWAQHGINVNALAPGYMATNNTQQLREDAARSQAILERIPAGRWGLPADLMGPAVFLASAASDYVNGYTLAETAAGWRADSQKKSYKVTYSRRHGIAPYWTNNQTFCPVPPITAEGHFIFALASTILAKKMALTPALAEGEWWHIVAGGLLTCLLTDIDHPKSVLGSG
ncbi:2-dehydro-3-deoxy-D-gluconate 5-dehydrogenase [Sodalis glossinidius str. 'morsitans']|uniref:2-dehydro-3-deoxy-D-gluconate 5-dehydrogenase n=1 Tax=Sodalis glossinidius (strain morsitans) TaxID=343509 RepID=A0A193QK37_SODGM|nr:2-dehydro-3-deoxy-D-gluconate 5-dehydrogenase [Sodalis glossinidius str. 'morsitans']